MRRIALQRSLGLALSLSLLVGLVAPTLAATDRAPASAQADWLRGMLRNAPSPALEAALEEAVKVPARTLDAFLHHVIAAYSAQQPDTPLATFFVEDPISDTALVLWLVGQQRGIGADFAVLPLRIEAAGFSATSSRTFGSVATLTAATQAPANRAQAIEIEEGEAGAPVQRLCPRCLPRAP